MMMSISCTWLMPMGMARSSTARRWISLPMERAVLRRWPCSRCRTKMPAKAWTQTSLRLLWRHGVPVARPGMCRLIVSVRRGAAAVGGAMHGLHVPATAVLAHAGDQAQWRDAWDFAAAILRELERLPIRSYNGEYDTGTFAWR